MAEQTLLQTAPESIPARLTRAVRTMGLTPAQLAVVGVVFVFTLIGAIAVAYGFRWWNGRDKSHYAIEADHGIIDEVSCR